jgi:hypothetical protein
MGMLVIGKKRNGMEVSTVNILDENLVVYFPPDTGR